MHVETSGATKLQACANWRGGEKVGSDQSGRVIKDLSGETKGKGDERKP